MFQRWMDSLGIVDFGTQYANPVYKFAKKTPPNEVFKSKKKYNLEYLIIRC